MPQTDYYGEVEATIDQLLGLGSTDRPVDGESRNTFKVRYYIYFPCLYKC